MNRKGSVVPIARGYTQLFLWSLSDVLRSRFDSESAALKVPNESAELWWVRCSADIKTPLVSPLAFHGLPIRDVFVVISRCDITLPSVCQSIRRPQIGAKASHSFRWCPGRLNLSTDRCDLFGAWILICCHWLLPEFKVEVTAKWLKWLKWL